MRYSNKEIIPLVGLFKPNRVVTIKVLDLLTDRLITLSSNVCIESKNIPGTYIWLTDKIVDKAIQIGYHSLFYLMSDDNGNTYPGKFVYGGYVDDKTTIDTDVLEKQHTEIEERLNLINARI